MSSSLLLKCCTSVRLHTYVAYTHNSDTHNYIQELRFLYTLTQGRSHEKIAVEVSVDFVRVHVAYVLHFRLLQQERTH